MAYVPKNQTEAVQKYTREYTNADGTVSIWHYDKTITTAGPYKVEHKYTKQFFDSLKEKKVAKNKKNS